MRALATLETMIGMMLVASAVALWASFNAGYGGAQEAEPTATPSIYDQLPTISPHHSSDVNFSGAVNVVDLFIVARDSGETGAKGVCAHVISEGETFDLVSCP